MNPGAHLTPRFGLALLLLLSACATGSSQNTPAAWSTTSVEFGQGQIHLGIRYRWVAERSPTGAVIQAPNGGEATVRVFACGQSLKEVEQGIRAKLRARLLGAQFVEKDEVLLWRWRENPMAGKVYGAAVAPHGPLLISATSTTFTLEELRGIVRRVRLGLPVPTIPSCLPFCEMADLKCEPQTSEDEG
jgi:hypothetical protein